MAKISVQNLLKLGFIQDEDEAELYSLEISNDVLIDFYSESETFKLLTCGVIHVADLNFKSIQEIKDFIKCFDHER